jgi:hypothetical protein
VDDKPVAKKKPMSLDDEDDRPRGRHRDEDDQDDQPRGRRRREEDDDRPRRKPRRDDDEDDDRGRGRRKGRRDEDDRDDFDDYDYAPPPKGSKFGVGRVGVLLLLISLSLYAGSMALHALFLLVALVGVAVPSGLGVMTGIMGLANWVVGLVGLGLCIAGPRRARGLAIAALSVAAVHLILAFVTANHTGSAVFSSRAVWALSAGNRAENLIQLQKDLQKEMQKNPSSARAKQLREELDSYREDNRGPVVIGDDDRPVRSSADMRWPDLVTFLPQLDELIVVLAYQAKIGFEKGWYLLGFFTGLLELARLILIAVLIGALARAAKRGDAESKAKIGWIVGASAVGTCLLVYLLTAVIMDSYTSDLKKSFTNSAPSGQVDMEKQFEKVRSTGRAILRWNGVGELLVYLAHTGSLVMPMLAALTVFTATGRRGR